MPVVVLALVNQGSDELVLVLALPLRDHFRRQLPLEHVFSLEGLSVPGAGVGIAPRELESARDSLLLVAVRFVSIFFYREAETLGVDHHYHRKPYNAMSSDHVAAFFAAAAFQV